jgi:hypothetical protein
MIGLGCPMYRRDETGKVNALEVLARHGAPPDEFEEHIHAL